MCNFMNVLVACEESQRVLYRDNFMYLYLLYKSGRVERHIITSVYGLQFKDSDIVTYQKLGEKFKLDMFCLSSLLEYQISCYPIEEFENRKPLEFYSP
jgi:hypothetical protein